jgi:hypothetical protein
MVNRKLLAFISSVLWAIVNYLNSIISFFFFKASVTHVDNKEKSKIDAMWTPPLDYYGPVTFV